MKNEHSEHAHAHRHKPESNEEINKPFDPENLNDCQQEEETLIRPLDDGDGGEPKPGTGGGGNR